MQTQNLDRKFWGKEGKLPTLDLTTVQKESFAWFLEKGIREVIDEVSPIEDFTGKNFVLEFGPHRLDKPKYTPDEAIDKGVNYDAPLRVVIKLTNKQTGKVTEAEVFLCDLPLMIEKGTFIINGIERAVVNQIVRAPGAYFSGEVDQVTGVTLYSAEIRPVRGSWLEFNVARNDVISVKVDRRRKFPATVFLRAMGYSTDLDILNILSSFETEGARKLITATLEKDTTQSKEEALLEIYRRMRPGDPVVLENAKNLFESMFFNARRYSLSKVGRFKIEKRLK